MTDEKPKGASPNRYWGWIGEDPLSVEDGIRARYQTGSFTRSWWARRWVRGLTRWADPARLARGRAYARSGQVIDLDIQVGLVLARVQGTRPTPYRVRIEIQPLRDAEWQRVVEAIASQAIYAAQLLNGEMPQDIEKAFYAAGASLFPESRGDLHLHCSCPDAASLCKHVAAVCLLLGEALDEDPFLLFVMRGRTQEQLMAALREERAARADDSPARARQMNEPSAERTLDLPLEECVDRFWRIGEALSELRVRVAPPAVEMEVIKMLGEPSFIDDETLWADLERVYRVVSQRALRVAYEEHRPLVSENGAASLASANVS